jgi:hypothetical protein
MPGFPQAGSPGQISANELLRRVIDTELKAYAEDQSHWMYRLKASVSGREEEKDVIQSKEGNLDRLVSVNGQPLTPQQEGEIRRVQEAAKNRREQQEQQRQRERDLARAQRLLRAAPDALLASYGESRGDLVELNFRPNPAFRPSSRESQIVHAMEGSLWVDRRQSRLAHIDGHLVETVRFGAGLLGHLDKGGDVEIKQSEVAPRHWLMTVMRINVKGKALFFKTIGVQQDESRRSFQRVADDLTLAEAAERLLRPNQVARRYQE